MVPNMVLQLELPENGVRLLGILRKQIKKSHRTTTYRPYCRTSWAWLEVTCKHYVFVPHSGTGIAGDHSCKVFEK